MYNNKTYNFSDLVGKKIYSNQNVYIYGASKKPLRVIKKNTLIGIVSSYQFNKNNNTWWLIFKDDKGSSYGIPSVKGAFPQIQIDKLTDDLINSGTKSIEELHDQNVKDYNKNPFTSIANMVGNGLKKHAIWFLLGGALYVISKNNN